MVVRMLKAINTNLRLRDAKQYVDILRAERKRAQDGLDRLEGALSIDEYERTVAGTRRSFERFVSGVLACAAHGIVISDTPTYVRPPATWHIAYVDGELSEVYLNDDGTPSGHCPADDTAGNRSEAAGTRTYTAADFG